MNARENPFSAQRMHAIAYRFAYGDWPGLLCRLTAMNFRGAIVGPEGAGKSTLLGELADRLAATGLAVARFRVTPERRLDPPSAALRGVGPESIILLDGDDLLGRWAWRKFRRRPAAGLVVTAHRPGLLPTLIDCATSPQLLSQIMVELAGDRAVELESAAQELFTRHRGDIREVLRSLYDLMVASDTGILPVNHNA